MRRFFLTLIYGALLLTVMSCSKTEPTSGNQPVTDSTTITSSPATKTLPANVVTADAAQVQMTAGGAAEALVKINIADGYHINGNPASKYQIATTLEVEPNDGITPGRAQYPPSVSKKFSFSAEPITVYEGQATIKVPLKAAADVTKGPHKLSGKLRVQPCDDQACYPPRSIEAFVTVDVK